MPDPCSNLGRLDGKTCLITGGNAGIGLATAVAVGRIGARVVVTARDPGRGEAAVTRIRADAGPDAGPVEWLPLDLASLASVRSFAAGLLDRLERIDVVDLNAGGVLSRRQVTEDGFETQFQVNHLAHFLLVRLLLDRLTASAPARVVVLSSAAHTGARRGLDFDDLQWERRPYRGYPVYQHTKLMNLLFTAEASRRLGGTGITVNALHPGLVATQFARTGDTRLLRLGVALARPFSRTPERGAQTAVWLAASPDVEGQSGGYYMDCRRISPSAAGADDEAARRLWEVSERLLGLEPLPR